MKRAARKIETQLAVIGTGIAGFAASLFARARGLEVAQFGHSGALAYTTGYLDLLGVGEGHKLDDPWAGLGSLAGAEPGHPLTRIGTDEIRSAIETFVMYLNDMGIGYTPPGARNHTALLPYGVTKKTLSLPQTMLPGAQAFGSGAQALILDFEGLQGFSAAEFSQNIASKWPGLGTARIGFPGMEGRAVFPEVMARSLETRDAREELAEAIRPHIGTATHVGLPAILGIHAPDRVRADLETRLGVTLFEIPTIPPGVPGIRLREMFERELPLRGAVLEPSLKVAEANLDETGATLHLHGPMEDIEVRAQAMLLATGRFLSGGLKADRGGVRESLLGLPIRQPDGRQHWHRERYLDPRGNPINRLGIETDAAMRPVGPDAGVINAHLFAAGAVLAGQDWPRSRSGAGLAIATAWRAVESAAGMGL